eukprot:TRINITY_DN21972_c0_g2_i1.p1 TRINITY_DN21972_c0_g2~~TRINITY_DN21972_c0_g2_i1.p1  ORF type:complete len:871 (-),score=143.44 TRINITY_DN21972_c0_g2_i1:268-2841(-)
MSAGEASPCSSSLLPNLACAHPISSPASPKLPGQVKPCHEIQRRHSWGVNKKRTASPRKQTDPGDVRGFLNSVEEQASLESLSQQLQALQDVPKMLISLQQSLSKVHLQACQCTCQRGSSSWEQMDEHGDRLLARVLKKTHSAPPFNEQALHRPPAFAIGGSEGKCARQFSKDASEASQGSARDAKVAAALLAQPLLPGKLPTAGSPTQRAHEQSFLSARRFSSFSAPGKLKAPISPRVTSKRRCNVSRDRRSSSSSDPGCLKSVTPPRFASKHRCGTLRDVKNCPTPEDVMANAYPVAPYTAKDSDDLGSEEDPQSTDSSCSEIGCQYRKWSLNGESSLTTGRAIRLTLKMRGNLKELADAPKENWWRPRMLKADANFRLAWDFVLGVCAVFLGFLLPIQLSYLDCGRLPEALKHITILPDILFLLDVFINFLTVQLDEHSLLPMSQRQVAVHYARTWLTLDLLASWPVFISADPGSAGYMLQRFFKLTKLLKLPHWGARLEQHFDSLPWLWAKVLCPLVLLTHCLACMWHFVRKQEDIEVGDDSYVADVYWVVMTMTTIGFGDIVPKNTPSRSYAIVVMLASSLFSGIVVALTTQAIKWLLDDEVERQVREVTHFMRLRRVPAELQRRVEHGVRHQLRMERSIAVAPKILARLSPSSQQELAMELLCSSLMRFPLFAEAPYNFVAQLAHVHTWVQAMAGDLVVEEGQVEENLVFVVQGCLMKFTAAREEDEDDDSDTDSAAVNEDLLGKGAWFGEQCLFEQAGPRNFTVIADVDSELAVLSAADFLRIIDLHPQLSKQHESLQQGIQERAIDLSDLAYRRTPAQDKQLLTWLPSPLQTQWCNLLRKNSLNTSCPS